METIGLTKTGGGNMGLLDWLLHANKNEAAGAVHGVVEFEKDEEEFHGLNMRQAIDAHINWKVRLENALAGDGSESLQVGQVAADDRCILGQWLHSEAKRRFGATSEFQDLVKSHADFHLLAGDILCDAHDGRHDVAREKLQRDFRQKSDRVQLHLVRLYARTRS
jgi:hypothetical protein